MTISLKLNNGASIGAGRLSINSPETNATSKENQEAATQSAQSQDDSFVIQASNEANIINDVLEYADRAYSEVFSLRQQQEVLAEVAAGSPSVEYRNELETELNNLETEIQRIKSVASYNGQPITAGATFTVVDKEKNYYQAIGLANYNSLFANQSLDLTSVSDASNSETILEGLEYTSAAVSGAVNSAAKKSADIIQELAREPKENPKKILEAELAKVVANTISNEIQNAFNKAQQNRISHQLDQVHQLDASRVLSLLS